MNGSKHIFLLFALAEIMVPLQAQQVSLDTQDMEDLLYRDESAILPEPSIEADEESYSPTINLNTASADELESTGIFTPYQVYQLVKYREKFGPLYSIHELASLPGFQAALVQQVKEQVSLNNEKIPGTKKAPGLMALVNLERSYPSPGSGENHAGSPLKSSIRIRSRFRTNLKLALSYEKDAGEAFLYRNRPQFLSGYLSFEGKGFVKHLVVGNYKLNQGLGLVNGTGFLLRTADLRITRQSFSRIRPYASLRESLYEQGLACRMGTEKFSFALWASCLQFSLSPSTITNLWKTDLWLDHQRTSGLFRTENELEGRDLAYRVHTGIHLLYRNQGLSLGVLGGSEWVVPGKKAILLLEKPPKPSLRQKLSIHGNWYRNKTQVFGELASSELRSLAFLLGTKHQFNDFFTGSLLLYHYGTEYRGSLPSSYGSGSRVQNEQGLAFHLRMESGKAMIIKLTGELFRYPAPRHLTQVPSEGYRLDLTLQDPGNITLQWRARLISKSWQTTPADKTSPVRPLLYTRVHRIDGQLIYNVQNRFRWLSRLVMGYCSHRQDSSTGYAAAQQLTYNPGPVKVIVHYVVFQVSDWANRIYLHEPGFYYSFSFPVFYGSGQKTTLLFTLKPFPGLSVSAKISGTNNKGKQSWESGLQLRLRL
jgi:hypothetical protein